MSTTRVSTSQSAVKQESLLDEMQIVLASRDGDTKALARLLKARPLGKSKPPYYFTLALACASAGGHLGTTRALIAYLGQHFKAVARENLYTMVQFLKNTIFEEVAGNLYVEFYENAGHEDVSVREIYEGSPCIYAPLVMAIINVHAPVVKELLSALGPRVLEQISQSLVIYPNEEPPYQTVLSQIFNLLAQKAGTLNASIVSRASKLNGSAPVNKRAARAVERTAAVLYDALVAVAVDPLELYMSNMAGFVCPAVIGMLLRAGAPVRNEYLFTILEMYKNFNKYIASYITMFSLAFLFDYGADPNAVDSDGRPLIFAVADLNAPQIFDMILERFSQVDLGVVDLASGMYLLEYAIYKDLDKLVPKIFDLLGSKANGLKCRFAIEDTIRGELERDLEEGRHAEVQLALWATSAWSSPLYPLIVNSFKSYKHSDDTGRLGTAEWWKWTLQNVPKYDLFPEAAHSSCSQKLYKACHIARTIPPVRDFAEFAKQHLAAAPFSDQHEWMETALVRTREFVALVYRTMRAMAYRFIGMIKGNTLLCYRGDFLTASQTQMRKARPGTVIEKITGPTSVSLLESIGNEFAAQYSRSILYRILIPNSVALAPIMFCSPHASEHELVLFERGHLRLLSPPVLTKKADDAELWVANVVFISTGKFPKELPEFLEIKPLDTEDSD